MVSKDRHRYKKKEKKKKKEMTVLNEEYSHVLFNQNQPGSLALLRGA